MAESILRPAKQKRIAAYKTLLRSYIDQRPSGMRLKIARVLGPHKSFISQITNPDDPTPLPARHLETIIDVCHLSKPEQEAFLEAYTTAHPQQSESLPGAWAHHYYKTLHIQVPVLDDAEKQQELEDFIRDFMRRLWVLMGSR